MPPADAIVLRDATADDAAAISALVIASTRRWIAPDCTDDGIAMLVDSMVPARIEERLREGHRHVVAEQVAPHHGTRIVGVAVLRLPSHLYHLFVADDMQRRGIARRLWQAVRYHAAPDAPVTVNASLHAVEAYRRLGFEAAGPARFERGLRFVPMTCAPR